MKLCFAVLAVSFLIAPPLAAQSADQEVVSVVDSPDPVVPGAPLAYSVTVRNNGPDSAVNGGLNISLPAGVTHTTDVTPAGWTCFWLGNNGTCNTPSFAGGATALLTINVQVDPSLAAFPDQIISATFFPSGTTSDPNSGNNSKTAATAVDSPQVNLSLTAFDSPDPVFPDGNVTYSVTVSQGGPDTASGVNFNVVPDSSLRFQSATVPAGWSCTLPAASALNATFTCSRPSWEAGALPDTFTIVFSANDEEFGVTDTTFQTGFSVNAAASNETSPADNSTTVTTAYVTPDANLSVTASDSPDPIGPDGDITYTVTVFNAGPQGAAATLTLPPGTTLKFQSITVPAGFSCSPPAPGNVASFSCTNPSFGNGASAIFTIVLEADAATFGNTDQTIVQNFQVTGDVQDPDNSNNAVAVSTQYAAPDANLGITATDSPDPVAAGSNVTYSGTVSNGGPDSASGVTFTAALDSELRFVSITGPAGFSCTAPSVGAAGNVTCTIASLANGASLSYTIVAQVDPALRSGPDGTVQSSFTIAASTSDPVSANNQVDVLTAYTTPDADLSVTNSDTPDPVATSGTLTYTQTITNNGPDTAENATFTQTLAPSVTFVSLNQVGATFACTAPAPGATGPINCSAASFLSGQTTTFTLVVTVAGTSGAIENTVTAASDIHDADPSDNAATAITAIAATSADLSIAKTTATTAASPGVTIPYTITVNNGGPDSAANVAVTDVLPASLLFQSLTAPAGFTCTTPAIGVTGTIQCTAPSFAGPIGTFALSVTVAPGATSGTVVNSVTVSSTTLDPDSADTSASASGLVLGPAMADLSIMKTTASASAMSGTTVTYTIAVANAGPSAAQNVVVSDPLPAGLQFVSATPTQGTCSGTTTIQCSLGNMPDGSAASIALQVTVTATSGTISNTASVSSDTGDPDAVDTTSTTPPMPVSPPLGAIPTLSQGVLLMLAAMLGAIAFVKLR